MTALWILLGILLFFVLLLSIPVHVRVRAENSDVHVFARVFFYKYDLFPMKKRKKKPKKSKKTAEKSKKTTEKKRKTVQKPKPKRDIPALLRLLLGILRAVLRKFPCHFRVKVYRYELSVATGDAAKTALLYGAATALSAQIFALLRSGTRFRIGKKAPVNVYADFLGEKPKVAVDIDLSITVFGALSMLMAAGLAFVKGKINAKSKDSSKKEAEAPVKN